MLRNVEQLETRAMCASMAGGHQSTLDLQTGMWDGGTFTEYQVTTGDEFQLAGCGFETTAAKGQGGGSRFTDPNYEYLYSTDESGCIADGGSSTYIAPDKPGWYSIEMYTWDDVSPYDEIAEGIYWIHVKK